MAKAKPKTSSKNVRKPAPKVAKKAVVKKAAVVKPKARAASKPAAAKVLPARHAKIFRVTTSSPSAKEPRPARHGAYSAIRMKSAPSTC